MQELGDFIYGKGEVRPCKVQILKCPNDFAVFNCIHKSCAFIKLKFGRW